MARIPVKISRLMAISNGILKNAGINSKDAQLVSDSLVDAEISGIESHGLMRLEAYIKAINKGIVNPKPQVQVYRELGGILKLDGDGGLGQVVTQQAFRLCMERTEESGLAVAAIKNTNHFGAAGYFTYKAAKEGYIAFASTNASPTMAPYGGVEPLLGTNPFSISFPAGKYDNFTLDIAMSAVARGKIRIYEKQNKAIPLGWAIDMEGIDTTDPKEALKGSLLPMGDHKGYGLAIIVDMLCGIISGAELSLKNESMFSQEKVSTIGSFIGVLKIDAFMGRHDFEARVEEWFDIIKASRVRPGFDAIYIPGESKLRRRENAGEDVFILEETYRKMLELHSKSDKILGL